MFTFGRDHEKKCAASYFRKPADPAQLLALIDAVHDLIEGKTTAQQVRRLVVDCFVQGGVRTWEGAGHWLEKAQAGFPELALAWHELAEHPESIVRERVACHLDAMPPSVLAELAPRLLQDRSHKVAAAARRALPPAPPAGTPGTS